MLVKWLSSFKRNRRDICAISLILSWRFLFFFTLLSLPRGDLKLNQYI